MRIDQHGSIWRQWDLHFHTPASKGDYRYAAASSQEIVDCLIQSGVGVVCITDHHTMDVDRIREMQKLAGDFLTILPGIELTSDLGGRKHVHFIGIFPEDTDLDSTWTKISAPLELTAADVVRKGGPEKLYVSFTDGAKLIHDLGGLISVHAGRKTNSFEGICNASEFKRQMKTDYLRDYIDILEIGSLADVADYIEIVFDAIGFALPLVMASDNHDIREYHRKAPCWIKADPTFAGLCQAIKEYDGRFYLGDEPPVLRRVDGNQTKYIHSISFQRTEQSITNEKWFSGTLPFNKELIAIIGNKGSGKSALADTLALLGNAQCENEFSFLTSDRFRHPNQNKAAQFSATLTWHSQESTTRTLQDSVDATGVERVKYIPQNYLETICNDFTDGGTAFRTELQSAIFSHVDDTERMGCTSLEDLLEFKTKQTQKAIDELRGHARFFL